MDKTIIVCGIIRNAERGLKHNMPVMAELSKQFRDFHMVLFENDSKDGTKAELKRWQLRFGKKLVVVSEDGGFRKPIPKSGEVTCNPFYSRRRISRMVDLRNQYMDYIEANGLDADYLMVVDLDVEDFTLDGILSSFRMGVEWDAVSANSHSLSPKLMRRYHDSYALTEFGDESNPQTEAKILALSEKFASIRPGDSPYRVFSAFGGITIYRFEAVRGLRYRLIPNEDPRVEVRCEHFSINSQMAQRGYTRTYINPGMDVFYQRLTLRIIVESLLRRLK